MVSAVGHTSAIPTLWTHISSSTTALVSQSCHAEVVIDISAAGAFELRVVLRSLYMSSKLTIIAKIWAQGEQF